MSKKSSLITNDVSISSFYLVKGLAIITSVQGY